MKQVVLVVPKGNINMSSITGSFEILSRANAYWKKMGNNAVFEICIAGYEPELTLGSGFFSLHPVAIASIKKADLIVIPSLSYDYEQVLKDNSILIDWIREQYKNGAEVASICTGAFLLAATGLLDGKSCSTHWNAANDFRKMFPDTDLQVDKLIVAEKGIYTNGGAYSFLNLILFLVEKYFNRETAIYCSKVFQIEIDRTSQSPFTIFQTQKNHGDAIISRAQTYIEEHVGEKISFEELASLLAVSRRNFDRRFIKATNNTPVEYLQRVKIEVAKNSLEKGRATVSEVMYEVGYADDKAFREVFKKITGISPQQYRAKYTRDLL
ncbi:GlxA family transcriptional regulator [Cytophaga hutchinsonii]|uniref:Transcriptional regulator, AraC family with amidase-like domain n=1 Tax=Cytophaga hutchinsonii (strain ATCC 33406 / DSM 1761 / CIP 103989 / NBRC 15051 / NCIMB 9469 / D465) TaxID=269798 RepID=A0A6N4STD7_CYTH3|nr:helix-turn-helix domain-containing protein [Cytophaga hutchinsonii]ABG59562.1 transcriptional regulator, AraC family with amidase-like domain [Cytophaga hutchinsonii ATCC 33406]SFX95554.1 transcriptional regulator, AraC family with amidase-like domain [Cytophaga hutchinsonii ATCC 33406]